MSFRQRLKAWNDSIVGDLNAFPYIVFVYYTFKVWLYIWLFMNKVANPNVGLFAEDNVKRMIVYNILGDVLGFNSTGGPLGFRMVAFFVTWYNLLMPGSLTCPLLPGIPAKRNILQSIGFVAYVYYLYSALCVPDLLTYEHLFPIVLILAILTPFDLVTFQASRGEHSGYMLVCCLFPWSNGALHGIRFCQCCLWFFAGTAKMGPWMKYVNAFMMPNSKILAIIAALGVPISDMLYKDRHGTKNGNKNGKKDVNPSPFLEYLAIFGVVGEVSLGPLCLFFPSIGFPITCVFHGYILSMTPFASVMEWNVFCVYLSYAMFGGANVTGSISSGYTGYTLSSLFHAYTNLPIYLLVFLTFVLIVVPIYGQLYPKRVPFLVAFRPYAGNWRFTWHIVAKSAQDKMRRLKTLEPIFVDEGARFLWGGNPNFCNQFEDYLSGNMVFFPHFRPLIPMIEKLEKRMKWKTGQDYKTLFNEIFLNAVTGWTLGTGYYVNTPFMNALTETCGFVKGECFVAVFEPHGLLDHTSEWSLVDVTEPEVKIYHGKMPYGELEKMQPCEMTIQMFEDHSVLKKTD